MQLHCFVHHSGTGPVVFEALHQFTIGVSIKRLIPKECKGKTFSCFDQIDLLFFLVAMSSYVIDICQWIYLALVSQSRDQFHDIIQRKLLSFFNELKLLLCWFWFDHICCNYLDESNQEKYLPEWIYQQFLCSFFWRSWNELIQKKHFYEISYIIPEMHLPYDPTVREGNYTNREEISYRDEDYHIAPVEEKY